MFRFEKLDVWQKAVDFAHGVYDVTSRFPAEERFGLTSQMRRAAVSILSNVAEGSGRASRKDFAHFLEISYGSLMEVVSQVQLSARRALLKQTERDDMYAKAEELARMLSGLKASLQPRGT